MDRHSASVDLVAISEVSLSFTMESKRLPQALLNDFEQIAEVNCEQNQAIICPVREDIHGKPGIAASVFNTVAEEGVNVRMISQGASEISGRAQGGAQSARALLSSGGRQICGRAGE